jgi:phenylacetate-coenzyme A ligase PaaK-like adenylate-forming protein
MLKDGFQMEAEERAKELSELAKFLLKKDLEEKLTAELGAGDPFNFARPDYRQDNFERWSPLGFLVHIAPTNAYAAGAWSVLEGLLSGNVNFLKTGGSDEIFAQQFLSFLVEQDSSGTLASRIFACKISSRNQKMLGDILANADGVVVWGDEGAISGIRALAPSTARFIDWGPKISVAYFAKDSLEDDLALEGLANECCRMEQQACSSPQIAFAEVSNKDELLNFARRVADKLALVSKTIPCKQPAPLEQAEITNIVELCRLESCLGLSDLIEAEDGSWRVLIEYSSVMKASPLYRTIWIKPLLRGDIGKTMSPLRSFLQTVGLACKVSEISELCDAFDQAGVLRITRVGKMLDSYSGEPHDGVFALQRYSRKISIQRAEDMQGIASFAELKPAPFQPPQSSIMSKAEFQSAAVDPAYSELFFKSGGSSGEPKLSIFTYDDYHAQMTAAANGLFAAGLDPKKDRCMNLFFAGGLYGGFISFFTVLETLKAVQFPMAANVDTKMVADIIVSQKCNVLLGMPSYIIQLFTENAELLRKHKVIEKIFYGGEHFNESQKRYFQEEFGVKLIRSGAYGSVDAGPIGYQCMHCTGSIHHLHSRLHVMELLEMENDKSVPAGEPGRVVLTSLARAGQKIQRYDIGDMARFIEGPCPCGRKSPRFELLGRHGDVFRIGSAFFNYGKFAQIFIDHFNYAGELQIVLHPANGNKQEEISVLISPPAKSTSDQPASDNSTSDKSASDKSASDKSPSDQSTFNKLTSDKSASDKSTSDGSAINKIVGATPCVARNLDPDYLRSLILDNYNDLKEIVVDERLLDIKVRLISTDEFQRTPGSGKLKRIIDERTISTKP